MSVNVGAFEVTAPVAAHIPGGGFVSMSFMLAARTRLETEAVEALVEVRERLWGVVGEFAVGLDAVGSCCG
jgi:hypothetical protein